MNSLTITSPACMLTLTLCSYIIGVWIQNKSRIQFLHPCLTAAALIIIVLSSTGISYETYFESNKIIHFMLGPSVVAIGVNLYEQLDKIRGHATVIITSVVVGSIVSVLSVVAVGWMFGMNAMMVHYFEPKSLTTPIAMSIAQSNGGNVSLTAVTVVFCGIVGAAFGPKLLKWLHVKNPIARGLAMGCASHGFGTARAMQIGAVEGAVSGLAIALMGFASALIIPLYHLTVKYFFA